MGGAVDTRAPGGNSDVLRGIVARAAQIGFVLAVEGALVFGGAGRLDWVWAWAYLAIYLASIAVNATLLLGTSPEMVAERGRPAEFKRWDAIVSGAWSLFQFAAIPLVAGVDARFAWSGTVDIGWHLAGALVFAAGLALFGWAMVVNAYFSTAARIQGDRGQAVCRTGPYRFVRHPGYSGTILQAAGMAVLLGSWWALLPALAAATLITLRTVLEDRMLQAELPGYSDYSLAVRFRLIPGIW
jgi:protein-S-isoprenylcysteine O-methyltransferase Ste14